ncbi:uncharacterized protein N0V89_004962 [Didymosphaeria variabile]|uniref:Uncharacterized protein n=1 Tax=Didymosphaeria variabile TaxID=1932322 RepID=A0A9W8XM78_9PLEO|nr:uncharacterized protein N0V89_004962 [Didymosphaeria variabile]KAJ4353235.1 hypothetical protein N0V89_004962 [Didymosphaeria variabile]
MFERLKEAIKDHRDRTGTRTGTILESGLITAVSAGAAGSVAAVVTTPIDVVKTRIMLSAVDDAVQEVSSQQKSAKASSDGLVDAFGKTVESSKATAKSAVKSLNPLVSSEEKGKKNHRFVVDSTFNPNCTLTPPQLSNFAVSTMGSLTPRPYGGSSSMPLLPSYTEGEAEQDHAMEISWGQVLQDIQLSPGYQLLFKNTGFIPSQPRRNANSEPRDSQLVAGRGENSTSSPRSDETIRTGDGLESSGVAVALTRPHSRQYELISPFDGTQSLGHNSVPQLSACAPVFQPTVQTGNVAVVERTDTPQEYPIVYGPNLPDLRGDADKHEFTHNHLKSSTLSAIGDSNLDSPLSNRPSGDIIGRLSLGQGARDVSQTMPKVRGNLHQRRVSSKFSFVPVLPSPLGPGHFTDDLGSDFSGLVSPAPAATPLLRPPNPHWHTAQGPRTATPTPSAVPFSWAQSTPVSYSPFDTSPASDPFVEHHPPIPSSSSYTPLRRRAPTPQTPQCHDSFQHTLLHPVTGDSSHSPTLIPPPPFIPNLAVSLAEPSPSSRARLDAQKVLRKAWIESKTHHLAATMRAAVLAKHQHERTQSPADYEAWICAQALFQEAWDVDRLTEERRNLTLPDGMRALKTGPGTLPCDRPCDGMGEEEGGVLGFKMALMERICAEVVVKEDACVMEAEYLNDGERRIVRKAVMIDVARGVEKRLGRQMR